MKLRESTIIDADAATVWPHLANPLLQAAWNPKIIALDRAASGPVHVGERFAMIYRMSSRECESAVEVIDADPPHRVAFLHRTTIKSRPRSVTEAYDIEPRGDGVKVTQSLDLTRSGIPWFIRPLIWFIHHFGRHAEVPYLQRLKAIVEQHAAP